MAQAQRSKCTPAIVQEFKKKKEYQARKNLWKKHWDNEIRQHAKNYTGREKVENKKLLENSKHLKLNWSCKQV